MVAILLQGRTHLNLKEFRTRGHLRFFNHVLGILQLLEPQLFDQSPKVLHNILEAYFPILPVSKLSPDQLLSSKSDFLK